ncbi:hypothetical protein CEP51_010752 [Fusarium floridanum]|uniref:Uncharacterized protein n=1 Tax=Fusarium floridanum TaxID=1325733 RepID=A0A428RDG3_9HYPO|nr:hypothetical protein CEP51_010752 [Fusarium floridanum]
MWKPVYAGLDRSKKQVEFQEVIADVLETVDKFKGRKRHRLQPGSPSDFSQAGSVYVNIRPNMISAGARTHTLAYKPATNDDK